MYPQVHNISIQNIDIKNLPEIENKTMRFLQGQYI